MSESNRGDKSALIRFENAQRRYGDVVAVGGVTLDIAALAETHNLPFSEAKAAVDAEIRTKLG